MGNMRFVWHVIRAEGKSVVAENTRVWPWDVRFAAARMCITYGERCRTGWLLTSIMSRGDCFRWGWGKRSSRCWRRGDGIDKY